MSALDYDFLREESLVFIKIFIGQNNSEGEAKNRCLVLERSHEED